MGDEKTLTEVLGEELAKAKDVLEALPNCSICEGNGKKRKATRFKPIGFGRWYLCDEHGRGHGEVHWAEALRKYEKAERP